MPWRGLGVGSLLRRGSMTYREVAEDVFVDEEIQVERMLPVIVIISTDVRRSEGDCPTFHSFIPRICLGRPCAPSFPSLGQRSLFPHRSRVADGHDNNQRRSRLPSPFGVPGTFGNARRPHGPATSRSRSVGLRTVRPPNLYPHRTSLLATHVSIHSNPSSIIDLWLPPH